MKAMKQIVNKQISVILLLLLSVFFSGCSDLIEKDITKKEISINSPQDGAQSVIYNQLFWWNKVDGATQYSIQIAQPSFDSLVSIIVDTIVTSDKFYKTLSPGKYQWRIRAENGAYKSSYQTYSLTMNVSSLDLQTVTLTAPANNVYQNKATFNFGWDVIPGASKYIIEIDTVSQNFVSPVKIDTTTDITYSYTFLKEGDYKWRVMGKDDAGHKTSWSAIFYTGYYTTAPVAPIVSAPIASATYSPPTSVSFSWSPVAKASTYTLHLYRNPPFNDTIAYSTETYVVTSTTKAISFSAVTTSADIYWAVSCTDKAGNQSLLSTQKRKITLQP